MWIGLPVRSEIDTNAMVQVTFTSAVYLVPKYVEEIWATPPRRIHFGNCTVFQVYYLRKQGIDRCYSVYNFI